MATWIKADVLEATLRASPIVAELQRDSTVDAVAMLKALANAESSYQVDAIGDAGKSKGLWQINTGAGWVFDSAGLGDVAYQIQAVQPVYAQANGAVQRALEILGNRARAGEESRGAEAIIKRPTAAEEQPIWYSIAWQYGAGSLTNKNSYGFLNWIAETFDTSAEGFVAYRRAHGRKVEATFYTRQSTIRSTYALALDPDRASFVDDVLKKTGTDIAELPGKVARSPWFAIGLLGLVFVAAAWSSSQVRRVTG